MHGISLSVVVEGKPQPHHEEPSMYVVHAIYIASTVLIILTNLGVLGVVLSSYRLRHSLRHLLMVSLAVADLLLGSFVCPLYIRTALEPGYPHCHLNLALEVVGDHGVFFVTGWTLVTLNLFLLHKHSWLHWPCEQTCRSRVAPWLRGTALIMWPWLVGLLILVPLLTMNVVTFDLNQDESPLCMLSLPENILVIVGFLSLYLPFYLVVASTITLMACSKRNRNPPPEPGSNTLIDGSQDATSTAAAGSDAATPEEETPEVQREEVTSRDNVMHILLPNYVYLVCYLPFVTHTWLYMRGVHTPRFVYLFILSGLLARSYLLPLSWLIFRSVREDVVEGWAKVKDIFCSCVRHSSTSASSSVSFSRLRESQSTDTV
ncbi:uncharacterized protein LOC101848344 [Aplysia californica]|uniref:Uncharacterized protein LOC101848344 n=1 Tax=Aplysia californica TaxID=6500 RepID=A0ABM0JLG7_APLCA|nr:uncharacterized protein LOC101848344 [Aplysia californica]